MKVLEKRVTILGLGLVLGAGCTSNNPDSPDAPDAPSPTTIALHTGLPPALVAFREETTATWQSLDIAGKASFEVTAHGPYRIAIACTSTTESFSGVAITEYARTLADGPTLDHTCYPSPSPSDEWSVRGTMQQSGGVWFDNFGSFGVADDNQPWPFEFTTSTGTFDLIALFGDYNAQFDKIAIRRGVAVTADVDLGGIDEATEPALPLVPVLFTASNLAPEESLSHFVSLETSSTYSSLSETILSGNADWEIRLAPPDALVATDRQRVSLSAFLEQQAPAGVSSRITSRGLWRDQHAGDPTEVTLPDALGPIAFDGTLDRLTATWAALPAYDTLSMWRDNFASDGTSDRTFELVLSHDFVATTGITTATLDITELPGIDPTWKIDPSAVEFRAFDVIRSTSTHDSVSSSISDVIDAPDQPAAAALTRSPQKLHAMINNRRRTSR